jgi:hypothetical protein
LRRRHDLPVGQPAMPVMAAARMTESVLGKTLTASDREWNFAGNPANDMDCHRGDLYR